MQATVAAVLTALALLPGSAVALVDAGVLAVEMETRPPGDCVADVGPAQQLCPVSWDQGKSALPGDDRFAVATRVDDVRATLRVPGADETAVAVQPSEHQVEHPAYRALNQTWLSLNDSRPEPLRPYVSFESRPLRNYQADGTLEEEADWGIFLNVYPPVPFVVADREYPYLTLIHFCWNICDLSGHDWLEQDEDSLWFPRDVFLDDGKDSDAWVVNLAEGVMSCGLPELQPGALCTVLDRQRPQLLAAVAAHEALTPTVSTAFEFHRLAVEVVPPDAAGPGAAEGAPLRQHPAAPAASGAAGGALAGIGLRPSSQSAEAAPAALAPPGVRAPAAEPVPLSASTVVMGGVAEAPWSAVAAGVALLLGAGWLYHRITRGTALHQETRKRIHDLVRAEPGLRVGTIAVRLGLAYPTVQQHVRLLEATGHLLGQGQGQRRYFAAGPHGLEAGVASVAVAPPSDRAVHAFLQGRGPADLQTLCSSLGLASSTVSESLARLSRAGLVARQRVHRRVVAQAVQGCTAGARDR